MKQLLPLYIAAALLGVCAVAQADVTLLGDTQFPRTLYTENGANGTAPTRNEDGSIRVKGPFQYQAGEAAMHYTGSGEATLRFLGFLPPSGSTPTPATRFELPGIHITWTGKLSDTRTEAGIPVNSEHWLDEPDVTDLAPASPGDPSDSPDWYQRIWNEGRLHFMMPENLKIQLQGTGKPAVELDSSQDSTVTVEYVAPEYAGYTSGGWNISVHSGEVTATTQEQETMLTAGMTSILTEQDIPWARDLPGHEANPDAVPRGFTEAKDQAEQVRDYLTLQLMLQGGLVGSPASRARFQQLMEDPGGIADNTGIPVETVESAISAIEREVRNATAIPDDPPSTPEAGSHQGSAAASDNGEGRYAAAMLALLFVGDRLFQGWRPADPSPPTIDLPEPEAPPATSIMTEMSAPPGWGGEVLLGHDATSNPPGFSAADPTDSDGNPQIVADLGSGTGGSTGGSGDTGGGSDGGTGNIPTTGAVTAQLPPRLILDGTGNFTHDAAGTLQRYEDEFAAFNGLIFERLSAQSMDRSHTADPTNPVFVERWTNGTYQDQGTTRTLSANQGAHWAYGVPAATLPTTGTANYSLVAATQSTYNTGATAPGTLSSASMAVSFDTPAGSSGTGNNASIDLQMSVAMPDHTYQARTEDIAGSPGFQGVQIAGSRVRFSAPVPTPGGQACASGVNCFADVEAFFGGKQGSSVGMSYSIHDNDGDGIFLNGAAAFERQ